MFDFNVSGDFNATEIQIGAVTERAKAFLAQLFGHGAVSVNIPKSRGEDLMRYFQQKGFSVG